MSRACLLNCSKPQDPHGMGTALMVIETRHRKFRLLRHNNSTLLAKQEWPSPLSAKNEVACTENNEPLHSH
jgi:hypothetical protein